MKVTSTIILSVLVLLVFFCQVISGWVGFAISVSESDFGRPDAVSGHPADNVQNIEV